MKKTLEQSFSRTAIELARTHIIPYITNPAKFTLSSVDVPFLPNLMKMFYDYLKDNYLDKARNPRYDPEPFPEYVAEALKIPPEKKGLILNKSRNPFGNTPHNLSSEAIELCNRLSEEYKFKIL